MHPNVSLMIRVHDLFSQNRDEEVLELVAPDVKVEMLAFGLTLEGRDGFRAFMAGFKKAFPDIVLKPTLHVADEGRVVGELVAEGTHRGPLDTPAGPIPPTGRRVTFRVCEVWDVEGGRIKGLRNYQDAGAILRQIGTG